MIVLDIYVKRSTYVNRNPPFCSRISYGCHKRSRLEDTMSCQKPSLTVSGRKRGSDRELNAVDLSEDLTEFIHALIHSSNLRTSLDECIEVRMDIDKPDQLKMDSNANSLMHEPKQTPSQRNNYDVAYNHSVTSLEAISGSSFKTNQNRDVHDNNCRVEQGKAKELTRKLKLG